MTDPASTTETSTQSRPEQTHVTITQSLFLPGISTDATSRPSGTSGISTGVIGGIVGGIVGGFLIFGAILFLYVRRSVTPVPIKGPVELAEARLEYRMTIMRLQGEG